MAIVVILAGAALAIWIIKQPVHYDTAKPLSPVIPTTPMEAPPPETPSAVLPPPSLRHDFVAQAMPTSFMITCSSETLVKVSRLTTLERQEAGISNGKRVIVLGVPGDTVAVVNDRLTPWASLPGSDAGPVSIAGHADADPHRMAFNPVAEYRGDASSCRAVIQVPGGTLTYKYVQPHTAPKEQWLDKLGSLSPPEDKGKLLVATCSTANDTVIWEFTLESSEAA